MAKFLALLLFVMPAAAFARLGDTLDQLEFRYGLQRQLSDAKLRAPLVEGAREFTFEYHGYYIRCALLVAKDGRAYTVRQEYRRVWQNGSIPAIRDVERDAILTGEASCQTWQSVPASTPGSQPLQSTPHHLTTLPRFSGPVWVRRDGALARMPTEQLLIVELPQVHRYEAELKAIKEEKAKVVTVPVF